MVTSNLVDLVIILAHSALTLKKTSSTDFFQLLGQSIVYQYLMSNTGNVPLDGPFTISDDHVTITMLPSLSILLPGQSLTRTASYNVTQVDLNHGHVTNQASAQGFYQTHVVTSNLETLTIHFSDSILSLNLGVNPLTYNTLGQTMTYSYTLLNSGNQILQGPFQVTDLLIGVTPWFLDHLGLGDSSTFSATYQVTQNDLDLGLLHNQAVAQGYLGNRVIHSNQASITIESSMVPHIVLTFVQYQGQLQDHNQRQLQDQNQSQLLSPKTSSLIVPGITPIVYTYVIKNSGNQSLTNVMIDDTNGIMINVGTLLPNQTSTLTRQYIVEQSNLNQGYILSKANAIGHYLLNGQTQTTPTSTLSTRVDLPQVISLHVSKTANVLGQKVGDVVQYRIIITNEGNTTLSQIHLTDDLLQLSVSYDQLEPSTSHDEVYDYIMTSQDFDRQIINNLAIVTAVDVHGENVTTQAQVSVVPCVCVDTLITMEDGTEKPIQLLQRGDLIRSGHHVARVARVCQYPIKQGMILDLIVISAGCLGKSPSQNLRITPNHPIFYQGARRPARCFGHFHGVSYEKSNGPSCVYDLQFDHDGSYWANGVEIQSCSPQSFLNPLPQKDYLDPSLYVSDLVWDSYDQPLPLCMDMLPPKKITYL